MIYNWHILTALLHRTVRFSSPYGEFAPGCDYCVPLCPRKSSSRRSRPRSFRDVLNVLLNVTIVSATVHRAHKFSFRRTLIRFVGPSLKDEDEKRRARATLIPTKEVHRDPSRLRVFSAVIGPRFRISIHGGTGEKKSYISRDRSGIHMLRCLAEIPGLFLQNELSDAGLAQFYFTFRQLKFSPLLLRNLFKFYECLNVNKFSIFRET